MYDFDLESYIGLARRLGTDTERVEVKAASQGLPKSMAETLSAFSNTSGGVVILGLAERAGFQGVPGFKARAVADALAQMCGEKMEPPVRASVEIVEFEGSPVVVATVPELPPELKPCFVKSRAMHDGSYVRVGDGDRRLSPYALKGMWWAWRGGDTIAKWSKGLRWATLTKSFWRASCADSVPIRRERSRA